jgi:hypothetical protein
MRLSKALWFAAVAALISVAPVTHAQSAGGQSAGSTTAKPGDKPAAATTPDKAGSTPAAKDPKATTTTDPKAAKPGVGADAKATTSGTAGTATTPAGTPASATTTTGTTPPTTAAPSATSGTAAAAGTSTTMDGSTYVVRLRDLEQRIDELKEQIRRSHTRLSLLSDTILSGGVGGARTEIVFKNDLSNAFRLAGAVFVLDGAVQYNEQDESEQSPLSSQREIPIYSGSIPPGDHTLQVVLRLRGHGYGVFSYLRGYKFELKSSHSFTITEGKTVRLEVVAWEKGDLTTPLEQRPAVRYTENLKAGITPSAEKPAAKAPGKANASGGVSFGAGTK